MAELSKIERVLDRIIYEPVVKADHFADKYYLKKMIKDNLPSISDEIIYFSIDFCNTIIEAPRKRENYIKLLAKVLHESSSRLC